jgi:hypothetical protein
VAFVLDYAAAVDYDREIIPEAITNKGLPWSLERSGFHEKNSLFWTFDFQPFDIPRPETLGDDDKVLEALEKRNRFVIRGSMAKVIVVCGIRAWRVVTAGGWSRTSALENIAQASLWIPVSLYDQQS